MDNITMDTIERPIQQQQQQLSDVDIKDENTALNVMVSFLHLAQKRGAFNLQESAKVWDCVKLFMKQYFYIRLLIFEYYLCHCLLMLPDIYR